MTELVLTEEKIGKAYSEGLNVLGLTYLFYAREGNKHILDLIGINNTWFITQGWLQVGGSITPKGVALLDKILGVSKKVDTSNKWNELHKELQTELVRLTSKKQVKANGGYTFLCNEIDLHNKLNRVITKYKLNDWDKIRKLLILHIQKAYKQDFQKIFLVQYYIEKNGMSTLASDYESFTEKSEEKEIQIEPKEIKNLF